MASSPTSLAQSLRADMLSPRTQCSIRSPNKMETHSSQLCVHLSWHTLSQWLPSSIFESSLSSSDSISIFHSQMGLGFLQLTASKPENYMPSKGKEWIFFWRHGLHIRLFSGCIIILLFGEILSVFRQKSKFKVDNRFKDTLILKQNLAFCLYNLSGEISTPSKC